MDAKKAKKVLQKGVKEVQKKGGDMEAAAMKEYNKMKAKMDVASKKVEGYIKKNPEKAMLISAGIAAALAGAATFMATRKGGKKKK